MGGKKGEKTRVPAGWIEQPTSSLRVTRSTTELSGLLIELAVGGLSCGRRSRLVSFLYFTFRV